MRKRETERDAALVRRRLDGWTVLALADWFGICTMRVYQILWKAGVRKAKEVA